MRASVVLLLVACRSQETPAPGPAPSDSIESTRLVMGVASGAPAPPPGCSMRIGGAAFDQARTQLHARQVATVHVEGDYTRTLAKVSVDPSTDAGAAWAGSFHGPRDAFLGMLRGRVCSGPMVHVLLPHGANDPSKGEVVLDAYAVAPDENADVDNLCHAYERSQPPPNAQEVVRDAAAMQWVEEVLTSEKWITWRHDLARDHVFKTRGAKLAEASSGGSCPTAVLWSKR